MHLAKFSLLAPLLLVSAIAIKAQDKELEKLITLSLEDLSNVKIITATKSLEKVSEVPATVRIITSEMIKERGYFILEDALADLPGFQFRNIQGFNSYVFQRGIPNQNNLCLLLVDGIEINEQNSGGFYAGGQFDLDMVERIEVLYGPASALYGTNAMSGVINIITKRPIPGKKISVTGYAGSFNTFGANLNYNLCNDVQDTGIRISGMIKNTDKTNLAGSAGDNNWTNSMENFENDYSISINGLYKEFSAGLVYQNKKASRTTNYATIGSNYLDKNTLWNIGFLNLYLKHDMDISPALNLQSVLYYRNSTIYDNTIAYITDQSQTGYYRPNYSFTGEFLLSWLPNDYLKIIGGAEFRWENLADNYSITVSTSPNKEPAAPGLPGMESNTLISTFLQAQVGIIDSVKIYAGGRFDHSTIYNNVFTPRLGAVYNYNGLTCKLLYSEAFRAPKPWDYSSGLGNPDLNPEKLKSVEAAGSLNLGSFNVGVSLYSNQLEGEIGQEIIGTGFRWSNMGRVKVKGAELTAAFSSSRINSYLNYSYNYSIDSSGALMPEISKHVLNGGVAVYPIAQLLLNIKFNLTGERKNPALIAATGNYTIDAALIFDASVYYHYSNQIGIGLTVKNLFNTTYFHTSNRPPSRYRQAERQLLLRADFTL